MNNRLALVTTLALTLLTPAMAGGAQGTTAAATVPTALASNSPDVLWMDATSTSNLTEIMTSQLALQKSANANVRTYAQRMIADHTKAQNELRTLASMKGVRVMLVPTSHQRLMYQKLSTLSGAAFDKMYMTVQVMGHTETVSFFEAYLSVGRDPQALAAARKYLPVIQMHLEEAQRIMNALP